MARPGHRLTRITLSVVVAAAVSACAGRPAATARGELPATVPFPDGFYTLAVDDVSDTCGVPASSFDGQREPVLSSSATFIRAPVTIPSLTEHDGGGEADLEQLAYTKFDVRTGADQYAGTESSSATCADGTSMTRALTAAISEADANGLVVDETVSYSGNTTCSPMPKAGCALHRIETLTLDEACLAGTTPDGLTNTCAASR